MAQLEVRDIHKSFGAFTAVDGISLSVPAGRTAAIVGASGCGKTTLLRLIAGFDVPDQGTVSIGDTLVADGHRAIAPNRRKIGYVAQDGALFPHLSVGQNVAYGFGGRVVRRDNATRVRELLEMVSLDGDLASRRPHELSGGQQQRVAIARALSRRPDVMLLDEPFSALDTRLRIATRRAVADALRSAGVTTVLVTHDQEEALSFADQVAVMKTGAFTQVGHPEEIYRAPVDRFTAAFLGDCVLLPATVANGFAECAIGRVPVHGHESPRATTIMLRPGQVVAMRPGPHEPASGTVVGREFLGSHVVLGIELDSPNDRIEIRQPIATAPQIGTHVRLEVFGTAATLD